LVPASQLQLNTASAADVDTSARLIRLLEGEILLTAAQSFEVRTRRALLKAQGARLNVRQFADRTQVALFEGRVELSSNGRAPIRCRRRVS
jgi:transmembrane sensor